jgi:RHS repeat-associated protein
MKLAFCAFNRCVRRRTQRAGGSGGPIVEDLALLYSGWTLVAEHDFAAPGSPLLASYIHGPGVDNVLYRHSADPARISCFYHSDALGSVGALTAHASGSSGTISAQGILAKYTYDAFGRPTVKNTASVPQTDGNYLKNRFQFQGREWLAPVRLNDHRNRLYAPDLGRWVSRDPIEEAGGINIYTMEYNSLTMLVDQDGFVPKHFPSIPSPSSPGGGIPLGSMSCSTKTDEGNTDTRPTRIEKELKWIKGPVVLFDHTWLKRNPVPSPYYDVTAKSP